MTELNLPQHIQDLIGATGRVKPVLAEAQAPEAWAAFEVIRAHLSDALLEEEPDPVAIYDAATLTGGAALFLLTSVFGVRNGEAVMRVMREQERQLQKWGVQSHEPLIWNLILAEEIGEAAQELYEYTFSAREESLTALREELVQVVAVCGSMLESLKRNQLKEVLA